MGVEQSSEGFRVTCRARFTSSKSATRRQVGFRLLNAVSFPKMFWLFTITLSWVRSRPSRKPHPVVSLMDHVRPYFSY